MKLEIFKFCGKLCKSTLNSRRVYFTAQIHYLIGYNSITAVTSFKIENFLRKTYQYVDFMFLILNLSAKSLLLYRASTPKMVKIVKKITLAHNKVSPASLRYHRATFCYVSADNFDCHTCKPGRRVTRFKLIIMR